MNARYYVPGIGRFASADSIVPNPVNPQQLNRYTYSLNNPVNFVDPSGHINCHHSSMADEGVCQEDGTLADPVQGAALPPSQWLADYASQGLSSSDPARVLWSLIFYNSTNDDYLNYANPETLPGMDVQQTAFILTTEKVNGTINGPVAHGDAGAALEAYILLHQASAAVAMLAIESSLVGLGRPCSFSADTLVMTDGGLVPIALVDVGEQVLAYNEITGEVDYYPVLATWSHEDPIIVYLTIDGEVIETTPEHPFYTTTFGWVEAGELWSGAFILNADKDAGQVQNIEFVAAGQQMYDLTVAGVHTFFVGEAQWLVHNCGEELAKEANEALQSLPALNRRATIGAARDSNGNLVLSVYGKNATESVQFLSNQGDNVLDAPPIGVEFHAERQLFRAGYTNIGISRQAGMCPVYQNFFANYPNATITSYSRR